MMQAMQGIHAMASGGFLPSHVPLLGQSWLRDIWFTKANSTQAADTDRLFMYIMWVSIISFIFLMAVMFYFVWKYRYRPGVPTERSAAHNTPLELAWSIVPLLIMVPIFFWGFHGYIKKQAAPAGAEIIHITGEKWFWSAVYDNGAQPREYVEGTTNSQIPVIYVPEGRPVKLIFSSKDVIHAFFIPDFRTKIDVTPNRYTSMWFQPLKATEVVTDEKGNPVKDPHDKTGKSFLHHDHHVFCAEYCGNNHSEMAAYIRVLKWDDYLRAKAELALPDKDATPAQRGEFNWGKKFGCRSCHSTDGTAGTGPSWKNMFGHTVEFSDGSAYTAEQMGDETFFANYVRESVLTPQAKIVKGFGPQMNSYQGQVKAEDLADIIAFMKTLSDKYVPPAEAPKPGDEGGKKEGDKAPPASPQPPPAPSGGGQ
jgi:cytochrome c oxidase subunit II